MNSPVGSLANCWEKSFAASTSKNQLENDALQLIFIPLCEVDLQRRFLNGREWIGARAVAGATVPASNLLDAGDVQVHGLAGGTVEPGPAPASFPAAAAPVRRLLPKFERELLLRDHQRQRRAARMEVQALLGGAVVVQPEHLPAAGAACPAAVVAVARVLEAELELSALEQWVHQRGLSEGTVAVEIEVTGPARVPVPGA